MYKVQRLMILIIIKNTKESNNKETIETSINVKFKTLSVVLHKIWYNI